MSEATENTAFSRSNQAMSLMEHLAELRNRIIASVLALMIGVVAAFFVSLPAIDMLKLIAPAGVHFVQLTPGEVVMASVRVAVILGAVLASPVILYQIIRFIFPGLTPREKGWVLWIVGGGGVLFLLGIGFAYRLVLPPTLEWLLAYGQEVAENQMSIARFVEFTTSLILITGVLFEMPVVLMLLSFTGLVTSQKMLAHWRMTMVFIFLFAAIITPSQDPLSMVMVGLAMVFLYGISILAIRLCGK